ncbi:MAG: TonB-dependent receptor [SAR86 cluster bacterium]|nr:TonB-dependent receptor [SAR86 cluster bacterium]
MKNLKYALLVISALITKSIFADEIEEVLVTSSFIDQKLNEIENPLHVVKGEEISQSIQSLGESLDNLLGVASTDYGPGVGQPIIRGMSGNRVKVLNNGMVVRDVSGLGADHINDVDLNNIQQVEVVRGPSSLLYSKGTIGGIVNLVDNTIARKDFLSSDLRIGLEGQSVNDGNSQNFSYQNNLGGLNISLAYKDSQFGNFDVPHGAILHTEDEHEEDLGYLSNSDYESTPKRFGISKTGDWGYIGVSFNNIESLYGIPFHGEEHEEHEEHVEHEGEEGHEEEEYEEERIFSTTNSDVFNLEGSYIFNNSSLKQVDYYFRDSDYSLTEQHAEGEEEHEEGPTLFKNNAKEYGAIFDLTNDSFSQKVVINFVKEDILIIGAEAYMNPSNNEEKTFGYYISKKLDLFHLDLGIRHDKLSRKGSVSHKEDNEEEGHEMEYFNRDINNTSFALSFGKDINDFLDINLGMSIVERAPSAVELFMNGPHLTTGRFEIGNTNLESEESNNIDLTFNYENNGIFGSLTFFKNDVDNYIYLLDETEEDQEEHHEDEHHEDLILANYLQKNAEFDGYEFEFGVVLPLAEGELSLSFGRDSVSGKFDDSNNIPRIVPARNIYSVSYSENDLELKLALKDVDKQEDVGLNETSTEGYEMLDLKLSKGFSLSAGTKLDLIIFGNNLLDEVARNHTSFVKNEVPLAGRNYGVRFNLNF